MTLHPAIALIEQRASTNAFDPGHSLDEVTIQVLARLATRAPSAYNLQNWRLLALRSRAAKAKLLPLAYGQAKVAEAAVTFVACGQLPDAEAIVPRLASFVQAGFMAPETAAGWRDAARAQYADPRAARDEAVRSASLGAATLMQAAGALGLASCPMVGFDAVGVSRAFGLADDEWPVMLVAVGRPAAGNWPQKPRRPLSEVLELA